MNREIADMRENYTKGFLEEDNVLLDPIAQFSKWFEEAKSANIKEPNAMILATVSTNGTPSARTVLLKELDTEGFIFYTNYTSAKAQDIDTNSNVSVVFLWKEIERQVRISGTAVRISASKSEAYFHSRPKGSQIGAWVSPQSDVIANRDILVERKKELEDKYKDEDLLPLPDFWGGYIIKPSKIEFWQGRPSRLHDRLRFQSENGKWTIDRLAP